LDRADPQWVESERDEEQTDMKEKEQPVKAKDPMAASLAIWLPVGIAIGAAFGLVLGNMAFMGIGIAIGTSLGVAMGSTRNQADKAE
jgi:hypothetical protein